MKSPALMPQSFKLEGDPLQADGVYLLPHPDIADYAYRVIFNAGEGWEHLSVSISKWISKSQRRIKQVPRCPTWSEMTFLKDLFWPPTEVCVQFHPAMSEYISNHQFVLHIWRPKEAPLPIPDSILVGLKGEQMEGAMAMCKELEPELSENDYYSAIYASDVRLLGTDKFKAQLAEYFRDLKALKTSYDQALAWAKETRIVQP